MHWATRSYDEEAAGRYIARAQSKRAAVRGEVFAVMSDGSLVGCVALEDIDWIHGSASAWLWIAPEARGRGLATLAWGALWRTAASRGITRVGCLLPANDLKGIGWAGRHGGVVEGVLRGRYLLETGRVDGVLLGFTLRP